MILLLGGFAFNTFMLFYIAPRCFPDNHYMRGFFEYGCCSGTTPIGLLLCKMLAPTMPERVGRAISIRLMLDCPLIGIIMTVAIQVLLNGGTGWLLMMTGSLFVFWTCVLLFLLSPARLAAM